VLSPHVPGIAIGVEPVPEFLPSHACAMRDQLLPTLRPGEIAHQLARQAERKIEAADPRAGARKQRLEGLERLQGFYTLEGQRLSVQEARCNCDRLGAPRRAGEVDAVDPHRARLIGSNGIPRRLAYAYAA